MNKEWINKHIDNKADLEALYETNKFGYEYVRLDKKPSETLIKEFVDKYKIVTDCHHSCITCQINQISKYGNELGFENQKSIDETGKPLEKWFPVECSYIPKGIKGEAAKTLKAIEEERKVDSSRAKKILLSTVDKAAWTELMFGFNDATMEKPLGQQWFLRWYQKHISRCTAARIVMRQGRRSGKTASMALKIIEMVFNEKVFAGYNANGELLERGPQIMIVTPFQSQITGIFVELEKFLKSNKDLTEEIMVKGSKLFTQTPPMKMEFTNGAIITGYVTGASNKEDGSGGGAIRGSNADVIIIDEMDMIPEHIFKNAIGPILFTRPTTKLIASSTPIGKKGSFYKYCLETPRFKEVYIPSTALSHWDKIEKEILSDNTNETVRSEYMAEFITESYGVFKNHYIQAARCDYNYDQTDNIEFWSNELRENYNSFKICMGIDWNQTYGTEYITIGFSQKTRYFYLLDAINLGPSKYSHQAYKEEVKRLNHKWKPNYIYPDHGYGHTMIEDLQVEALKLASKPEKTEYERLTASLIDKIHPINFSSNLELYNPAQGTYFEKYAKSFLVENAIQLLEQGRVRFPESESVLIKQLGNYIVVKKMDNGRVIYGQENESIGDHRLDAFLLALGGIALNEDTYAYDAASIDGSTYLISNNDSSDSIQTQIEKATDFMSLVKRNPIAGSRTTIMASTYGSREKDIAREREINEQNRRLNYQKRSNLIDPIKSTQGFFSSKGLATYSPTHSSGNQDLDIGETRPVKLEPGSSRNRKRIRTKLFGGR